MAVDVFDNAIIAVSDVVVMLLLHLLLLLRNRNLEVSGLSLTDGQRIIESVFAHWAFKKIPLLNAQDK